MPSELPLGLDFVSVAAHAINILVLFVALRFLLYKPVRKFLDEREKSILQRIEDVELKEKNAQDIQKKYEGKLKSAKIEAEQIVLDARKRANERADDIIIEARTQAKSLESQARADIVHERSNAQVAMREEVADLAIGIAGRVLEREVNAEDNKRIIETFLNKKSIS